MSTVLVTGATGFLGSVLVRRLLQLGRSVRILRRDHSKFDLLGDAARHVEHVVGDVTDVIAVDDAVRGVDRIYHAAAFVGLGGRRERSKLMRVNVEGTAAVVNAAVKHGVDRLLHVSSMAAFGRTEKADGMIHEGSQWQRSKANTDYAYSKYLSELEVGRGVAEGLDAVVINPALMFGVGRAGENTRRIVDRVRTGRLPAIPSGGTNVVDVLDVAEGAVRAMERGRSGERYFLGAENLAWRDIIICLTDAFGTEPPRLMMPSAPAMVLAWASEGLSLLTRSRPLITRETARISSRTYRYDNTRARNELGWEPRPFRDTAHRIAAALDETPDARADYDRSPDARTTVDGSSDA